MAGGLVCAVLLIAMIITGSWEKTSFICEAESGEEDRLGGSPMGRSRDASKL